MATFQLIKLADALDRWLPRWPESIKGPKVFGLRRIIKAVIICSLLGATSDRDVARKLRALDELKQICEFDGCPSNSTISRAKQKIDFGELFYQFVTIGLLKGLITGEKIAVDGTIFKAYRNTDRDAKLGYCASKEMFIFGYKAHIAVDIDSELPVGLVLTSANKNECKWFFQVMKSIHKNFSFHIKKVIADAGYDSAAIRKYLHALKIDDVIPYNQRKKGQTQIKPKDPDYNKRSAVERLNSTAKENFGMDNLKGSGFSYALQHTYLSLGLFLISALVGFSIGIPQWRAKLF